MKFEKIRSFFTSASVYVLCAFMIPLSLFLFASSMLHTTIAGREGRGLESVAFTDDGVLLNITALLVFVAALFLLRPVLLKLSEKKIIALVSLWTVVFGFVWVLCSMSSPTHDSLAVSRAAYQFSRGDYSALDGDYFSNFPFQLGYVLYTEVLIRLLFIRDVYLVLELVNIICLAGAYVALLKITGRILRCRGSVVMCAILLMLCIQPVLFSTFLYGNIPGFMFAAYGILYALKFMEAHRVKHGMLTAVMLALAVMIKLNNLIVLVAVCIILLVDAVRAGKAVNLAVLSCAVLLTLCVREGAVLQYELRSGREMGGGIPMISWAAMGLSEAYTAPGWYSSEYTVGNYNEAGRDSTVAAEKSAQVIRDRLREFSSSPSYAAEFFYKKTLSQWNEPSFQSIWTNQVRGHYYPAAFIAKFVCGEGEGITLRYMDLCVQLVYFCAALFVIYTARSKNLRSSLLCTVILGGFLYHTVFEGKSQYIITYFMLMIPLAACGAVYLHRLFRRVCGKITDFIHRKQQKTLDAG